MRSRLHSDIGRFTGVERNGKRARDRGWNTPARQARQSLLVRSSWDLPRASRLLFASVTRSYSQNRTTPIGTARAVRSYLRTFPRTREIRSRLPREFRNWMFGTHLKQKEKGITRNDHSRDKFLIFSGRW